MTWSPLCTAVVHSEPALTQSDVFADVQEVQAKEYVARPPKLGLGATPSEALQKPPKKYIKPVSQACLLATTPFSQCTVLCVHARVTVYVVKGAAALLATVWQVEPSSVRANAMYLEL